MAGLLISEGGHEPPSPSDLQHAGSNGKANGNHALVSAVDAQANHLKAGAKESPKRKKVRELQNGVLDWPGLFWWMRYLHFQERIEEEVREGWLSHVWRRILERSSGVVWCWKPFQVHC